MIVNFAGLRSTLGVDLNFAMADGASYRMTSTGGLSATDRSQIALGANGVFKGDALSIAATGTNNACAAATCQGSVMGFFAGTAAERAALAYGIAVVPDAKNLAQQALVAPTSMAAPTTVLSGVVTLGKQGPVVTNVTSTIPTKTPAPKN
jgi:hypothetical protein